MHMQAWPMCLDGAQEPVVIRHCMHLLVCGIVDAVQRAGEELGPQHVLTVTVTFAGACAHSGVTQCGFR